MTKKKCLTCVHETRNIDMSSNNGLGKYGGTGINLKPAVGPTLCLYSNLTAALPVIPLVDCHANLGLLCCIGTFALRRNDADGVRLLILPDHLDIDWKISLILLSMLVRNF